MSARGEEVASVAGARWRPMTEADLPVVDAFAQSVHALNPEPIAVYRDRLAWCPEGQFVAEATQDGAFLGHAIAHPGRLWAPPPLGSLFGGRDACADTLYLHDVALTPAGRGRGLGAALIALYVRVAGREGLGSLSLISVYGSRRAWERQGFVACDTVGADLALRLSRYGGGPVYMVRPCGEDRVA